MLDYQCSLDLPYEDTSSKDGRPTEHTVEFEDFPPDATEGEEPEADGSSVCNTTYILLSTPL